MNPDVYEGNEKYIFISYAHRDSDIVLDVINAISQAGYRIWYDDGIEAGSEWPETIAQHLDRAAAFVVFISPNSVVSDNCRNEINFALSRKKPFLSVFIADTDMPLGIELQIASKQGVIRSKCKSRDEFISKIINSDIIAECRRQEELNEDTGLQTDGQEPADNRGGADVTSKIRTIWAGLSGYVRTNRRKLAIACAAAVLIITAVSVLYNQQKERAANLAVLRVTVIKAPKAVTRAAKTALTEAEAILSEAAEGEDTSDFEYKFDYPSFSGKEITVNNSKELENALKDAGNGDTIKIRSGEYETDRTLFIDKEIRLCGEGDTKPVIRGMLRVRTGGVLIDNIEISITDSSQTYDSEYREDRCNCIEADDTDKPTYIRDTVLKARGDFGCVGVRGYGDIVMENSNIDTDGETVFLTAKAELNGNTLKSSYRGIVVWGYYGIRDNPPEKVEEFRNNNTILSPVDIESVEI